MDRKAREPGRGSHPEVRPEIVQPEPAKKAPPSRRIKVGAFKVPARFVGSGDPERDALIQRYKKHMRGLASSKLPVEDLDESIPLTRRRPTVSRPRLLPESRFRPGGFGSEVDDDADDE